MEQLLRVGAGRDGVAAAVDVDAAHRADAAMQQQGADLSPSVLHCGWIAACWA